ncbi:hypothetical protein ES332_A11G240300v1 [Gossypium tomentosum]|uniref:Uncharacterized protein n=1 Tax=Gossypium tomentosum TaxID=34277 RepID=A0A5D2NF84_GOSTO|nr:hypothetical protein ES332_A11G240300v1 [Gossypium tomentosum]
MTEVTSTATQVSKILFYSPIQFKGIVEKVKQMGFSPERFTFSLTVIVLGSMRKSTWETKIDVYKKYGWFEEEVLYAFKNHPSIMAASEGRIKTFMDFFVNVMGFKASLVAKKVYFPGLSMEKRL